MYKISKDHLLRLSLFVNIMTDITGKSSGIISIADLNEEAKKRAWNEACRITKETVTPKNRDNNYRR